MPVDGIEYDEGIGKYQSCKYSIGGFVTFFDPQNDKGDKKPVNSSDYIKKGYQIQFQFHDVLLYWIGFEKKRLYSNVINTKSRFPNDYVRTIFIPELKMVFNLGNDP